MNVLMTGATGLIGSALLDRLLEQGHSVVCLSRSEQPDRHGVRWITHDLSKDPASRIPQSEFDVVYHLAGQTSTYRARQNPIEDASVNAIGLLNLLEYCRRLAPPPFVVNVGTATEVGLTERLPINEDCPDRPVTFYDISKLAAEMYLMQYVREGWVRGCSLRLANVFGRRARSQQADRGILDKVFAQAAAGGNVTIYGDGSYLRDYLFIDDVVSALVMAGENADNTNGRHFCIGSGKGITLKDAFLKVMSLAAAVTGVEASYQHVAPPADLAAIERRNAIIDSSAFRQATGWVPLHDFDSGLDAAYRGTTSK